MGAEPWTCGLEVAEGGLAHPRIGVVLGDPAEERAGLAELACRPGDRAVNCGAIAQALLESELFGHAKGAFSGATAAHDGLIRAADGGTLLLDELAELPPGTQVALLRVLQEREVRAVGATRSVPVDLRLVTATHADMPGLVEAGRFRADLFARLAGFSCTVPPLRERMEDFGSIVATLLGAIAGTRALSFHPAAARALFRHRWPLNIRELEQALRVAVSVAEHDTIELEHLPEAVRSPASAPIPRDARYLRLVELFRAHRGNVSAVARTHATSRAQVRRLSARYDLDPDSFRGG